MIKKQEQQDGANTFLSQMVVFSIGPILSAAFSFASAILVAWIISPDELGKVSLFLTILSLLVMFSNLGLDRAYIREYSSTEDKDKLLYNCLVISLLMSLLVAAVIVTCRQSIAIFLFDQSDSLSVILLAIVLPLSIFGEYSAAVCRLKGHVKNYTIAIVSENVSYFIYVIIMYLFGAKSYRPIIIAKLLAILTKSVIVFALEKNSFHFFGRIDTEIAKKALRYGIPYMPALLCAWLLHSMDKYSLRMWSTYSEIGFYASAYTIVSILAILKSSFSSFWTPLAYKWYDQSKETVYFEKVGDCLTTALMCCSAGVILFRNVIYNIYKPEYSVAADVVTFLLFVISMETISYVSGCGINLKRKTVYNLISTLVSCIVNFIGNYILVPRMGAVGASISTGVSSIVYMVMKTLISRRLWYKFPIKRYFINTFIITLMASAAILFETWWIDLIFVLVIIAYNYKTIVEIFRIVLAFIKGIIKKRKDTVKRSKT